MLTGKGSRSSPGIIAMTAHAIRGAASGIEADMDDHLSKPTNLQESGDKLERCGETETELARGRGYDAEDLLRRVGGDHFLLKEVIGIFLAESPELLSRLDRA
jgi:CheY-like chemotaxis protein